LEQEAEKSKEKEVLTVKGIHPLRQGNRNLFKLKILFPGQEVLQNSFSIEDTLLNSTEGQASLSKESSK
jgi:hypothetical protein